MSGKGSEQMLTVIGLFVSGLMVGGSLGAVTMALLAAAREDHDDRDETVHQ